MAQTPKGGKYPLASLADMARIPADRRPAMLASLPAMLDSLAQQVAMLDLMGISVAAINEIVWTDDDDDEVRVKLTLGE